MKFLSILAVGAFALLSHVQAQSQTTSAPAPSSTATSAFVACLNACDPADTECRARCAAVPSPNQSQVNATNNCIADCPQGNGTAADIQAYISCRDGCIGQNYFTTGGAASPTGSSGDDKGSATGTGASPTGSGTGSDSDSPSNTNGGADATDEPGAASSQILGYSVGILGLFAAMLAL